MAFLDGRRSQFAKNGNSQIDNIIELHELPPSKITQANRYKVLISQTTLNPTEREELNQLTAELEEYIISAEKWNFFGDVIVNIQKFFKDNVMDFVTNKKQEVVDFVTGKQQEITNYADEKKNEVESLVTSESGKITNLVSEKTETITNLVQSKSQEINSHVDEKKQEMTTFVTQKTDLLTSTITQKEEQFNLEMNKMTDKGEYNPSTQYHVKNIIRFDGNVYMCIKDALGKHPTNTTHWVKLTIKGDTGYGVGLNPKDVYSPSSNYATNDLVQYNGNLYRAVKPSKSIFPSNQEYWSLFLSGNGELLNNLQTEDKFSLVDAINENNQLIKANKQTYDDYVVSNDQKIQQVETSITTNRNQLKKEIQDEFNPKVNGKASKIHTHQTSEIVGLDNRINEAVNPNSILTKLKTVDGANSGLDADLLGGVFHSQYVQKESGKGLSTNDYTTTEKNKLKDLPTNDALNTKLNGKVDKVDGKTLSSNDYTNEDKNKLQELPNRNQLNVELQNLKSFDIEDFADLKGCTRYEEKLSTGVWQVLYKKNNIRIVEQFIHPKNDQGKFITTIKLYNDAGNTITKTVTITEYKQGNQWVTEVV